MSQLCYAGMWVYIYRPFAPLIRVAETAEVIYFIVFR